MVVSLNSRLESNEEEEEEASWESEALCARKRGAVACVSTCRERESERKWESEREREGA